MEITWVFTSIYSIMTKIFKICVEMTASTFILMKQFSYERQKTNIKWCISNKS